MTGKYFRWKTKYLRWKTKRREHSAASTAGPPFFQLELSTGIEKMRCLVANVNFLSLLVLLAACVGCGEALGPSGTVSGTAKINGTNLKAGTLVTFTREDGTIASATVAADGTYVLKIIGNPAPEKIPVGSYKVAVNVPASGAAMSDAEYEAMMNSGGKPPESKKDTSVPSKYNSGQTSGLVFDIKEGENKFDIDLK
jgi:hypothetical protein